MKTQDQHFLQLNDITCYKIAYHLSNYIWAIVITWDYFTKDTAGKQLVRATDSISANIAEGFGRFFKKDKVKFYRYAAGSLKEVNDWIHKSKDRKLIATEQYNYIFQELEKLQKEINSLTKYTNLKLKI